MSFLYEKRWMVTIFRFLVLYYSIPAWKWWNLWYQNGCTLLKLLEKDQCFVIHNLCPHNGCIILATGIFSIHRLIIELSDHQWEGLAHGECAIPLWALDHQGKCKKTIKSNRDRSETYNYFAETLGYSSWEYIFVGYGTPYSNIYNDQFGLDSDRAWRAV